MCYEGCCPGCSAGVSDVSSTGVAVGAEGKAASEDLLGLWKDADPSLSLLKQAKAEYAALSAGR